MLGQAHRDVLIKGGVDFLSKTRADAMGPVNDGRAASGGRNQNEYQRVGTKNPSWIWIKRQENPREYHPTVRWSGVQSGPCESNAISCRCEDRPVQMGRNEARWSGIKCLKRRGRGRGSHSCEWWIRNGRDLADCERAGRLAWDVTAVKVRRQAERA